MGRTKTTPRLQKGKIAPPKKVTRGTAAATAKRSQPIPNHIRGRPLKVSESGLVRLNAIREEVKDSVESDPLRHDFVSITTLGESGGNQHWCGDCQFQEAYDSVLFPGGNDEKEVSNKKVKVHIFACSVHCIGEANI